MRKKIFLIIILLLWVGVIFSFSLQPAETSSQISSGVGRWLVEIFFPQLMENLDTMPVQQLEFLHTVLRKCGHFSEFFILGILAVLTFQQTNLRYKVISEILFCMLVASIDETIQLFVDGRSGQVSDVVLDSIGAIVGIGVVLAMRKMGLHLCKNKRI